MSGPDGFFSAEYFLEDSLLNSELFNLDSNDFFNLGTFVTDSGVNFDGPIPNDGLDLDSFSQDENIDLSSFVSPDAFTSPYFHTDNDITNHQDTLTDEQLLLTGLETDPELPLLGTEAVTVQSPVLTEHHQSREPSPEPAPEPEPPSPSRMDPYRTITKSPSPPPANSQTSKAPSNDEGAYVCQPHVHNNLYAPYSSLFKDSAAAKAHRRKSKHQARTASDIDDARRNRDNWVKRIYESMVDVSVAIDGRSSWQYKRFGTQPAYEAEDLEAAAHNVFDRALSVHLTGWTRPLIYQKVAVRGKRQDKGAESVLHRLEAICAVLQQSKAAVDEAVQGGLKLAKLCYNPYERKVGKKGNKSANINKASQIAAGKAALAAKKAAEQKALAESKGEGEGAEGAEETAE
jgi:hypothetical protein